MAALDETGGQRSDLSGPGGYSSFHDVDTSAEVDAAFRSQRRIAVGYVTVFLIGVLGVAVGTVSSSWSTDSRVFGGFSPSFLMTAFGLYIFFVVIGLAAASLANGVDDRMMGASSLPDSGTELYADMDVAPEVGTGHARAVGSEEIVW